MLVVFFVVVLLVGLLVVRTVIGLWFLLCDSFFLFTCPGCSSGLLPPSMSGALKQAKDDQNRPSLSDHLVSE